MWLPGLRAAGGAPARRVPVCLAREGSLPPARRVCAFLSPSSKACLCFPLSLEQGVCPKPMCHNSPRETRLAGAPAHALLGERKAQTAGAPARRGVSPPSVCASTGLACIALGFLGSQSLPRPVCWIQRAQPHPPHTPPHTPESPGEYEPRGQPEHSALGTCDSK